MAALEELFDIYPSKKFETHMGAEAGFDIESTDGEVVAECFAVTTAASNGKLKKDSEKLINKASKQKKYIYFYSQKQIFKMEKKKVGGSQVSFNFILSIKVLFSMFLKAFRISLKNTLF